MLVYDRHFQIVDLVFLGKFPEFTLVAVAAEGASGGFAALERAGPVLFARLAMEADEAWTGMPAQQQLDNFLAEISDNRGSRLHHHAFSRRRGAGWRVSSHAFDLNYTEPAGAVGFQGRVVAESGDFDSGLSCRFKNRVSSFRFNQIPVNRKGYFTHAQIFSCFIGFLLPLFHFYLSREDHPLKNIKVRSTRQFPRHT
jgi:hypothetical protein